MQASETFRDFLRFYLAIKARFCLVRLQEEQGHQLADAKTVRGRNYFRIIRSAKLGSPRFIIGKAQLRQGIRNLEKKALEQHHHASMSPSLKGKLHLMMNIALPMPKEETVYSPFF